MLVEAKARMLVKMISIFFQCFLQLKIEASCAIKIREKIGFVAFEVFISKYGMMESKLIWQNKKHKKDTTLVVPSLN